LKLFSRFFRSGPCFSGGTSPPRPPSLGLYTQCDPGIAFCASHSLAEVYSTLTLIPLPHRATPDQAVEFLESIHRRFCLVSLEGSDYLASIREAAANRISGGAVYDALIARCAVQAGADQIFTGNIRHYKLLGAEVSKRVKSPVLN
jgi:predicted nucleic acid-binding protein